MLDWVAAHSGYLRPLGEWNFQRVIVEGSHYRVELNGVPILDADMAQVATEQGSAREGVAGSRQFTGSSRCRFGILAQGDGVRYRNLRVAELGWESLFDGESLAGWTRHNGTATYRVENGEIVGTTAEGSPNSFLCTEKSYRNFVLEFETKVHNRLNSGVQLRSDVDPAQFGGRVYGPQVEIEKAPGEAGHIFSEATRRGWLSSKEDREDPEKRRAFRNGEWNHYRVEALGPRIRTWVNGQPVGDIADQRSRQEGFLGLQVHSIGREAGPFEVRWRNLRIRAQ